MKIAIENYEAFLIDYLDGKLNPFQVAQLKYFVSQHPELGSWTDLTSDLVIVQSEAIIFEAKNEIKNAVIQNVRKINATNCDEYFIAYIENEVDEKTKSEIESFVTLNPDLATELTAFKHAKLVVDLSIHFPNKNSLKHLVLPIYVKHILAYAAIALLFLSVYNGWFKQDIIINDSPEIQEISQQTPKVIKQQPIQNNVVANAETEVARAKPRLQVELAQVKHHFDVIENALIPKKATEISFSEEPFLMENDFMLFYFDGLEYLASLEQVDSKYEKTSVAALVTQNLVRKSSKAFIKQKAEAGRKMNDFFPKGDFKLWNFAQKGIKSFNDLTNSELDISRKNDSEGKLRAYRFNSEHLAVSRSIGKEKAK